MSNTNSKNSLSQPKAYKRSIFPHYFTSKKTDRLTGQVVDHTYECQGTAYIAEKTGLPERTIRWRAKQGYIPNVHRMGVEKNKRIVYFWLTEQADAYVESIKPKIDLNTPSNDEYYSPLNEGA